MLKLGIVAIGLVATACTRPNPDYCADTSECTNGLVCDLESNRCVEAPAIDAALPDGSGRRCDPAAPFGTPELQTDLSSSLHEVDLTLTSDERTAVVERSQFVYATRTSTTADFDITPEPTPIVDILAVEGSENEPGLNRDGLTIYFARTDVVPDPPTFGIFVATRTTSTSHFGDEAAVTVDSSPLKGSMAQISRDGYTLYWWDPPEQRIYSAQRTSANYVFNRFYTRKLATTMTVSNYAVSADELTLYYSRRDPEAVAGDVFVSTRASRDVPFEPGAPLTTVNSTADDLALAVTDDECILYLSSNRDGGFDIWAARRGQ